MSGMFASFRLVPSAVKTVVSKEQAYSKAETFQADQDIISYGTPFDVYGTAGDDSIDFDPPEAPGPGQYFNIHAGDGDDQVYGSASADRIDGGNGRDILFGQEGNDRLLGGAGHDDLYGGRGNDTMEGGTGNDWMSGGYGADTMNGGDGDDHMFGYGERGGSWNDVGDVMNGGAGNDFLYGEGGDDVLNGGAGYDQLSGGAGADRFVFTHADRTDMISGFNAAEGDKIDVSALLDSLTSFKGTTAQEAFSQGYLYLVQDQGKTTLYVDRDGGAHGQTMLYVDSNGGLLELGDIAVADLMNVSAGTLSSYPFIV